MRDKKLIIANWKMHFNIHEASLFVHSFEAKIKQHRDVQVVIAPTMLAVPALSIQVDHRKIKLAAQNLYWRDSGPYTGEVSANQLRGLVDYALIGHSERRHIFGEPERDIRNKVQAAIRNGIKPVLCIGETASERSMGETQEVLHDQIASGLRNVTAEEMESIAIAYEPVWAIGTGNNASIHDVAEAIKFIRAQVKHLFGAKVAGDVSVLYGGSVSLDSAGSYLDCDGVDGLLVGGASLNLEEFAEICKKAHKTGSALAK